MADVVKLGPRGELVLPSRVRTALGLREGDELLLSFDEQSIVVTRKARRFGEYLDRLGRVLLDRDRE